MAGAVMLNAKVLIGGYNFSGIHNSVSLDYGAEMLDETVFQDGVNTNTRKNKAGLKTFSFNGNVFWDNTIDDVQFNRVGGTREVMTFANIGEAEGDICFITRGITYTYNPISGEIGQLLQATLEGRNSNQELIRARTMKYTGAVNGISTTGNTTGLNLGSLDTKKIAMAVHVFSPYPGTGGETISFTVESDDGAGFATPVVRLTSATFTERGSDWQETTLSGVADAFWRVKWTVAGATPGPFLFAVSFGWVL